MVRCAANRNTLLLPWYNDPLCASRRDHRHIRHWCPDGTLDHFHPAPWHWLCQPVVCQISLPLRGLYEDYYWVVLDHHGTVFVLPPRLYHISRLLLIGAAIHNLAEWSILIQISAANTTSTKVKDGLRRATFFIIIIVFLVVMMPTLELAVLIEQSFGIMLDFALPIMYWYMRFTGSSERVRSFYQYPAVAHTIHLLFTILPLVFANFHVGQLSWYSSFYLETAIYISAPVTHILYMVSFFLFAPLFG